jgi:hypothetical protein
MEIIKETKRQKKVEVVVKESTFDTGDEITTIILQYNGTRVEFSVQEWVCGHKTSPTVTIHDLREGVVKIFEKTTKKSKTYNDFTVSTIKSAENNLSSITGDSV